MFNRYPLNWYRPVPFPFLGVSGVVALAFACSAACAAESPEKPGDTLAPVTVGTTRDPVDKSYRKILKGMDLFEAKHSLAPNASLRFRLLPRRRTTNMDGIALKIAGDTVSIPVPVAPDHTFTLERNRQALDEDASVMPDRKAGSMTWRAEIRTPGLPPDTRRLGDLRLECQVGITADLVSNTRPFIGAIAGLILRMTDYCNGKDVHYLFFAGRPIFSIAMVAGARRETLSVDDLYAAASRDPTLADDLPYCDCEVMLDRTYFLPLGDRSWPDDTLIEFEYMDDSKDRASR
jgi:hypothetical protein